MAEHGRGLRGGHDGGELVEHVDLNGLVGYMQDVDILEADVLHIAAAPPHGLDAQPLHGIPDAAACHKDVPHPAGDRAADDHRAVAAGHGAVADHHVLARLADAPAVLVHARVQGDAVIPGEKVRILDQHVPAGIGVQSIGVVPVGGHMHPPDDHILAVHGMQRPLRAVHDAEILQQHPAAVDQLDKGGPQRGVPGSVHPSVNRGLLNRLTVQRVGGGLLTLLPVPPRLSVAKERPLARDGDLLAVPGINQGGVVIALDPLPAGQHRRQIALRLRVKGDAGIVRKVQPDPAVQMDGPALPCSLRDQHGASAQGRACVHRGLDGRIIPAGYRALRETGLRNRLHGKGSVTGVHAYAS